jgi:hypothetical protein
MRVDMNYLQNKPVKNISPEEKSFFEIIKTKRRLEICWLDSLLVHELNIVNVQKNNIEHYIRSEIVVIFDMLHKI